MIHPKFLPTEFFTAMLEHAPAESGKRYVATVLHVVQTKGLEDVKRVVDLWR